MSRRMMCLALLMLLTAAFCVGCGNTEQGNSNTAVLTAAEQTTAAVKPPESFKNQYDLLVAGGEPEGVAAAVAAAEQGLSVLLICEDEALGGLYTIGELNMLDVSYYSTKLKNTMTTQGFFKKFFDEVGDGFDVEAAKAWFLAQVEAQESLDLMLNAELGDVIMEDKSIGGLTVNYQEQQLQIYGSRIIDATADADIAYQSGVPYSVGAADYGTTSYQAVTLIFELSGVSYDGVKKYVEKCHKNGDYSVGIDARTAYGYGPEAKLYKSHNKDIRLRGPNIGFQNNGNVLLNALLITGVNALDEQEYAKAIEEGKQELKYAVEFMRENFMGFEQAQLVRTASKLYVRETRHIYGEYRLTIDDVLENRDFDDRIAIGAYPVDIQPISATDYGTVVGNPAMYAIPYRCTVPLEVDNLWVVGRSASYDSLPHGSARTVPIGICVGEAIGTAAAYSLQQQLSPRELCNNAEAMSWLQTELLKRGAYLSQIKVDKPAIMSHWSYEGIKLIRSVAMIHGGYNNDYKPDAVMSKYTVKNMSKRVAKLCGMPQAYAYFDEQTEVLEEMLNENTAFYAAYLLLGGNEAESYEAAIALLKEKGIADTVFLDNFSGWDKPSTNGEACYLLGKTYQYLKTHSE